MFQQQSNNNEDSKLKYKYRRFETYEPYDFILNSNIVVTIILEHPRPCTREECEAKGNGNGRIVEGKGDGGRCPRLQHGGRDRDDSASLAPRSRSRPTP